MELNCYSRLNCIISSRNMKIPDLYRKLSARGVRVNVKSLYRLNDPLSPVEKIDARIAAQICDLLGVDFGNLFAFRERIDLSNLKRFPASKQKRLAGLLDKNREGRLNGRERKELLQLVEEAETLMLSNARALARQRQSLNKRQKVRKERRKAN